jgi:hypothetical protein
MGTGFAAKAPGIRRTVATAFAGLSILEIQRAAALRQKRPIVNHRTSYRTLTYKF